jgi:high-affinity iron transporter
MSGQIRRAFHSLKGGCGPFIAPLLLIAALCTAWPARAERIDYEAVAAQLVAKGDALAKNYTPATGIAASQGFSDLYIEGFETRGLEYQLGSFDRDALTQTESAFSRLISLTAREAGSAEVQQAWQTLRPMLIEAGRRIAARNTQTSRAAIVAQAALIVLREGLEAMLVLMALVTVLRRSGRADKTPAVWWGLAAALAASLGLAAVLQEGGVLLNVRRETLEGLTVLSASVVLAYVSCWLLARRDARRWQTYLTAQIDAAANTGSLLGIGLTAFLAVFREGAETLLFIAALSMGTEDWTAVGLGGLIGGAGIAALYLALVRLSLRMPIGPMFTGMGLLLSLLALSFVSQGVTSLQVSGVLSFTPMLSVTTVRVPGFNLSVESIAAQTALTVFVVLVWLWQRHVAATPAGQSQ